MRILLALALAGLPLFAGCAQVEGDSFQAVRLGGALRAEGLQSPTTTDCDSALLARADLANRTIVHAPEVRIAAGVTEAIVVLDGRAEPEIALPCFAFQGLQPQPPGPHAAVLDLPGFHLEVPFALVPEGVVANGTLLREGDALSMEVDQAGPEAHYRGEVVLQNLGRWPFSNVTAKPGFVHVPG